MDRLYRQWAPWPEALEKLVVQCGYRPGWRVTLEDVERDHDDSHGAVAGGLTLSILTKGTDSYHPERGDNYRVYHYFPVPPATYNEASWRRWLFDCFLEVETHEAMEFFSVDGDHCFAATHGPGDNPYIVHDYASDLQRRTRFTGEVLDAELT